MQLSNIAILILLVLSCLFSGCSSNEHTSFSRSEIAYFKEISLNVEYGVSESKIMKWPNKTLTIKIYGKPDERSLKCLNSVIVDFNKISKTTQLKIDDNANSDIDFYFVPDSEFSAIEPKYVPGNRGFFYFWIKNDSSCEIVKSRILISTALDLTPNQRCHIIREELTQSLGFFNDSPKYPNSIFFNGWTDTTEYSEIDKSLIAMLYNTNVPVCGKMDEVENYFSDMRM